MTYDQVLKLDDYKKHDVGNIFSKMNLNENVELSNLEKSASYTTDVETCNYFKNISQKAAVGLYERYKIDFEMFEYDPRKYFECTNK